MSPVECRIPVVKNKSEDTVASNISEEKKQWADHNIVSSNLRLNGIEERDEPEPSAMSVQ